MAEAHQAVAFQFRVTEDGIDVHLDREAVKTAVKSLLGLYKTRYVRFRNALLRGVFPASPLSFVFVLAVITGIYWYSWDPLGGLLTWIENKKMLLGVLSTPLIWILLLTQSAFIWLLLSYAQRYTLKGLLTYQGWMFDSRGVQSLPTKIWALCVRVVSGPFKPMLYSYQKSLPRLPVPSLQGTCERYLESVRPLLNDTDFKEMEGLVADFKNGAGKKMQRYLILKSWWANNYVTDWWEMYVYLYGRSSIMINSNYYACDSVRFNLTTKPSSRAALVSYTLMKLKKELENGKLTPLIVSGLVPLCSAQYERLFGTTRIPGIEADKLVHVSPQKSQYCVAYCKGRWYKVQLVTKNKILSVAEMEQQFLTIWNDGGEVGPGEEHLASLTAWDRKSWAETRDSYFSSGVNKESLDAIEKAAFVLMFDDQEPVTVCEDDNSDCLSAYCKDLLHGRGHTRWFDKSVTLIIYANGKFGINAEHSWADAPIVGYALEYCCNLEHQIGYKEDGTCIRDVLTTPPKPQRLRWGLPVEAVSRIETALAFAHEQISDLDLYVLQHDDFGKGDIKLCKISPDAFIQMALQLAYFKDSKGHFCLTYEASMTRLFLEGRTETVRPVTVESSAFVRAMCDPDVTISERKRLLHIAVEKHTLGYKLAMTGKGVDRHLFCLYVMSRYLKLKSPFLDKVLSEPWRLSTSQTPAQQTGKLDFNKMQDRISPGGGFGPVAKDGYGVSYIIQGDFVIYFHVSSFHSSPNTDSRRFAATIKECMAEMRDLVLKN